MRRIVDRPCCLCVAVYGRVVARLVNPFSDGFFFCKGNCCFFYSAYRIFRRGQRHFSDGRCHIVYEVVRFVGSVIRLFDRCALNTLIDFNIGFI